MSGAAEDHFDDAILGPGGRTLRGQRSREAGFKKALGLLMEAVPGRK
jgi:hypothetical protein